MLLVVQVTSLVVSLLRDSQVEVREMASSSVAVLVRIKGDDLALSLQDTFYEWACEAIPKRLTGVEASASLQLRHAGVLGLAALIASHPYDVPAWMPAILVKLASHIGEPMPIKQTVKNTFGEFWRTHQDAWTLHKDSFDEDQLVALTNLLVSPTYFS
jgi:proteasome activator subunit 4